MDLVPGISPDGTALVGFVMKHRVLLFCRPFIGLSGGVICGLIIELIWNSIIEQIRNSVIELVRSSVIEQIQVRNSVIELVRSSVIERNWSSARAGLLGDSGDLIISNSVKRLDY